MTANCVLSALITQFDYFQYFFGIAINVMLQVRSSTSIFPESLDIDIRGRSQYFTRDSLALSDIDRRHLEIQTKLIFS